MTHHFGSDPDYASSTEPPRMKMPKPSNTDHMQPNMCPLEDASFWFWYLVGGSVALTGLAYTCVWLFDRLING